MRKLAFALVLSAHAATAVLGTETENQGMRILPPPGKVTVDGKIDDWDLSGGIFSSHNLEEMRDEYSAWFHMMYDARNLYVLARVSGKHPPSDDSLRLYMVTAPDKPEQGVLTITCRQEKDGADVVRISRKSEAIDAKPAGARQAFRVSEEGRSYIQEIAIPLSLLAGEETTLTAGSEIRVMLVLSLKGGRWGVQVFDNFMPGVPPERTGWGLSNPKQYGPATFEPKGKVDVCPVHLSDGRELSVTMKNGQPVIDWADLKKSPPGVKRIAFTMPRDGFVSLNIRNADGAVVRQLLNCEPITKGNHTAAWDGLTNPIWKTPGKPVPPGTYRWSGIWHTGIALRLRGWACHGSSDPWDNGPTTYWGGDHALPTSCAADDERVYLGWAGAEAGKALIACDFDYNVQWAAGQHFNGCCLIAADRGVVYYVNESVIRRVDPKTGTHSNWPGRTSPDLQIKDIWGEEKGPPTKLTWVWQEGFAAHDGKLYLSFSSWDWQRSDIVNWRDFLAKMKADDRVGKVIWSRIDKRCQDLIDHFLGGNKSEDEVFKAPNYYTPDVRDVVIGVLQGLLAEKSFVEGGDTMTREKLAEASRHLIENTFPAETVKAQSNFVAVVDAETGTLIRKFSMDVPGKMVALADAQLYMFQGRDKLILFNAETGEAKPVVTGLRNPGAVAAGTDGEIYVACEIDGQGEAKFNIGQTDYHVRVYSPDGTLLRTIGRKEGRVRLGPWDPTGMTTIWGLCLDPKGRLWVAETSMPKRFIVWDAKTGAFIRELIGPTHYGASGGTINPLDPDIIVGEGCEFRIDPKTGHATMTGIISTEVYHNSARFCQGSNGKLYLAATFSGIVWGPGAPPQIRIWERVGEGNYAYRAVIRAEGGEKGTVFWADANGDSQEQPEEVASYPKALQIGGYYLWSMNLNTDLTFYGVADGKAFQFKAASFTACGAPKYDLANARELPMRLNAPLPSPDNRLVASCDEADQLFRCYDVASGKLLWTYPNTYHGVHGSHNAPGPVGGLIRGAFGFIGNASMPKPIGSIWVINTNVGEWHVLTEDGFYLTRLFQPDAQKWKYPEKAIPGADVTNIPPGMGGEDFGGSFVQGKDGRTYLQAGKVALWDIEATGFESVKAIKGGETKITESDAFQAEIIRGRLAQAASPAKVAKVRKATPSFTGNLNADFPGAEILDFRKQDGAAVRVAAAWDEQYLYLGCDVQDSSPWMNGADEPEYMYTKGDTVDLQMATDPKADKNRGEPVSGDLRLSIGNFKGKPTAVIYRKVDAKKNPKTFSSGVVKEYTLDGVTVLDDAKIEVKVRKDSYTVESAIRLASLGLGGLEGLTLRGDFGATHSDINGQETTLRTFWSNQATGIVNDDVFELKMEPRNWGQLIFKQ